MFEIDQFVADCRAALTERSGAALQEVVARAVSDPAAVTAVLGEPSAARLDVLFHDKDLTVLNVVWGAHQWTLPHNHNLRAVIGMYSGREDNIFWRRLPEAARIDAAGARSLLRGDVTLLGRDIIHSVTNPLGKLSCALHVYDGDFYSPGRSHWDAETLSEQPYDGARVSPMFAQVMAPGGWTGEARAAPSPVIASLPPAGGRPALDETTEVAGRRQQGDSPSPCGSGLGGGVRIPVAAGCTHPSPSPLPQGEGE